MRILLIGEYSNVHATLAKGLQALGHSVTLLSNGDFWKDYPRDIDLVRKPGKLGGLCYLFKLWKILPRLRDFDIVQLINPMFLELKAERIFPVFRYLRQHNKRVVLGAFGMDWYWVNTCCTTMPLRYSDFNIGTKLRDNHDSLRDRADWMGTAKEKLNKTIAQECDGIVAGLYEYWICYQPVFPHKTVFIPYPIQDIRQLPTCTYKSPLKLFIGISKNRSAYKGTDIMLRAAQELCKNYHGKVVLRVAEGVPFRQYTMMMEDSDAILDQLYSYTPSMNPLGAMAKGIICIGGGEPENYEMIHESELFPIINVKPTFESVYHELEQLVQHPERIHQLKQQSIEYVRRHHEFVKVAKQYEVFYQSLL